MDQNKSILIATGIYPPDIGGPATYVAGLAPRLEALGYNVRVLTYANRGSISRRWPFGLRHFIYFLKALWFGYHADIIYLQDLISAGFPTILANLFLRRKLVLKIVGDYAWEQGQARFGVADDLDIFQKKKYGLRVELLRGLQLFVARRADQIIVPSKYLAGIVAQWKISSFSIVVIYNAVDINPFASNVDEFAHSRSDRTALLTIGRLVLWKGFRYLIELMRQLPEQTLYIVGDGPERSALEKLSRELCVEDRVRIVGSVSHDKLVDYFSHARVFLLNSRYEGLSHVLIESLLHGVPVIATNIGGNPEVIYDGENGFLVTPDSSIFVERIKKLYTEDAFWEKMSRVARQSAHKFTWETHMRQLAQYLEVRLPDTSKQI